MKKIKDYQILQSWFASSFPVGSFNYSHGIETAIQNQEIQNIIDVHDWIKFCINNGSGYNDAILIKCAYQNECINEIALSLCAGYERFMETKEMGSAFSKLIKEIYKITLPNNLAYPVAIGNAAKLLEIDLNLTISSYLQAFASNLISVAVKSIPLGQTEGQKCLFWLMLDIQNVSKKSSQLNISDLGGAAIYSDICSLKHETLSSRIYKT